MAVNLKLFGRSCVGIRVRQPLVRRFAIEMFDVDPRGIKIQLDHLVGWL